MSATSVGQIGLDLVVNSNQFQRQMSGITSLAKKAGAALAGAFAIKKLVQFGQQCVELGSDLAEVQNVVDVTFPAMTSQVDAFAKSAISSFGLSETMTKKFTGTFGAMAKAFGFSEAQAYEMSTTLTGLAGDVASFYNITQDEAYTKLKSVFSGETETLKDLGVVMTQSALDAYAMANGWGKTTQAMSEAEKVALRYQFVQDQLSAATGDFVRTSDSWANQVRVLKLQFDSLKATIGQGLINLLTPVLKVINTIIGKLSTLANAFKAFTELITGKKASDGAGTAAGLVDTADASQSVADANDAVSESAKKAGKEMRALMGFDKINKLSDTSDSGSSGAGSPSGSSINFGALAEGETVLDQVDEKFSQTFENIRKQLQPTTDAFKRLWNEGLAALGNFTWTALGDFYHNFLVPVGQWTLGEGIPRFVDALNDGLMLIDFGKINDGLNELWAQLVPFTSNIGEGLLWFWEKVLVPLGTWTANEVIPRFLEGISSILGILNPILEAIGPVFDEFYQMVLKPIADWTGGLFLSIMDNINGALSDFGEWLKANPDAAEAISAVLIGIAGGLLAIKAVEAAATIFNPITAAITAIIVIGTALYENWDVIREKAVEIWGALKDWFEKTIAQIGEFFVNLWKGIENTFRSIGDWFGEKFNSAAEGIQKAFSDIGNFFVDIWSGIKNTFGNVAGWFKEKFSAAWQAVKNVFSTGGKIFDGIKDGILSGLKAVVNAIIGGINKVISVPFDGINWALQKIKSVNILGLKPFDWISTINVPQIPKLAQGGYVKANTPQLAMIGDNRHQGEIVAPESKLREMALEVAQMVGSGDGNKEVISLLKQLISLVMEGEDVVLYVDGEDLARSVQRGTARLKRRYGKVEFV